MKSLHPFPFTSHYLHDQKSPLTAQGPPKPGQPKLKAQGQLAFAGGAPFDPGQPAAARALCGLPPRRSELPAEVLLLARSGARLRTQRFFRPAADLLLCRTDGFAPQSLLKDIRRENFGELRQTGC